MALNQEIWQSYIMEQLYRDNEFLNYAASVNADNIVNGKFVHIPNAGAKPGAQKNRVIVPASIQKRTDVDVIYPLDEFTSDPTYIENVEKVELSYDKIDSVLKSHVNVVKEKMADSMIYNWLLKNTAAAPTIAVAWATGEYVAMTGTNATNGPAGASRTTMNAAALRSARLIMNKANVPKENRFAMLTSNMYDELMLELSSSSVSNIELLKAADLPKGVLLRLYGFNIIERSSVGLFSSDLKILEHGTTEVNTQKYGGFCWQKDLIEKAIGEVSMFENQNDPVLYGDVYSALVRSGGRARYSGATGVVPIIQAT
jgi:hypothetical protein